MTFEKALENSLVSSRMEGYQITDDIKKNCECLIKGEITISQLVEEIKNNIKSITGKYL